MSLYLGNTKLDSIYLGSTKIGQIYKGSNLIYQAAPPVYPYLLFQCDGYNGGHPNESSTWVVDGGGRSDWTQISSSPNIWKLEITRWAVIPNLGAGLACLFSSQDSTPAGTITSSCRLIGSGNMDVALGGVYCQTFDRMFANCTGLTYIEPIHSTTATNVGGMFSGCTNVEEGALAQYNWFNTYGVNINNHSSTFANCGSNTVSGLAELNQIPVGWGGNLVPASTLMTSIITAEWGSKAAWKITGNAPDWTDIIGMYIFTEASVSTYAGVSMNRNRITKRNGLGTRTADPLYFYPAFSQYTGSPLANRIITWVVTTTSPNGHLNAGQGNRDMPGTLDSNTYGSFAHEYGTYDSGADVYFLFLVTNRPIDEDSLTPWGGLSDAYGVLYNNNFKTDAGLRYYF